MSGLTGSWSVSGTTATYKIGTTSVKITGLKSGLKVGSDGNIAGIDVTESSTGGTMTLSKSVLTNSDVSISGSGWKLALNSGENFAVNTNAGGWLISGSTAYLLDGSSSGYELSEGEQKITYTAAKPGNEHRATISGLKEGLVTNIDGQIEGITVTGNTITVTSKDVLNKTALTLTSDKGYKLAVGTGAKPQVGEDPVWTSKGTNASFTAKMTYGYEVDSKGTTINYVAPKDTTVTLSGLKKDLSSTVLNGGKDEDGNPVPAGIEVKDGVITLHDSVLNATKVTVKGADYALALDDDVKEKAAKGNPDWVKADNATKATYNQAITKGYFSDGKTITYYKNESGNVVLATLSGLTNESTLEKLKAGVAVEGSVITLKNRDLFGTANITLGKSDAYDLSISDESFYVDKIDAHWNFKSGKATIENGTTDGFELKDGKTVNYVKATTTVLATVTGLPTKLDEYTPYDADNKTGGTITGLAFTEATFDKDGKVSKLGTITVSQDLLDAGEDVLVKGDSKTGVKKLSLGAKDNYYFLFDTEEDKVEEPTDDEEGAVWEFVTKTDRDGKVTGGTGNANYTLATSDGWAIDTSTKGASKTINYVAAKTTTLASISGLTTDLLSDDDGGDFELEENDDGYTGNVLYTGGEEDICAIKVTAPSADAGGKITLNESVFGGKKITLKGSGYTLALDADYDVKDIAEADAKWKVDKSGKAVLTGGKSEGYVVDAKSKGAAINYTAAKTTALATISGLGKNLPADKIEKLADALNEEGVTTAPTATAPGTITLNDKILTNIDKPENTKVTLGNKDNYVFNFDSELDEYKFKEDPVWELDPKGTTATYSATMQAGYSGKGTQTVTYTEEGDAVLATLSGLKDVDDKDGVLICKDETDETAAAVTVEDGKINLLDSRILGTKVTLKNGAGQNYKLALGDGLEDETLTDPQWNIEKSKATYYTGTSGGYSIDAKTGLTASYVKPQVKTTLATISGLKSDTTVKEFEIKEIGSDKLILITGDALSTSAVSLKGGDGYKLSLYGVDGPLTTDNGWSKNGANAVYTRNTSAGWTVSSDGKSINYSKEKLNETVVTVSGLTKDTVKDEVFQNSISLNKETYVVTVKNALLSTSNVTAKSGIKGEDYTLAVGSDVAKEAETKNYWTIAGGKATYTNGTTPYYTASASTITYHKPTVTATLATISGLKKTATEAGLSLDTSTGVITVKDSAIDTSTTAIAKTKVTLKNGTNQNYSLALGDGLTAAKTADAWSDVSKGKSTYERGIETNGYLLSNDALSITYATTADKKTTLATLSGVQAKPAAPSENGVITLTADELNETKASLGSKDPYTLALDSGVAAPTAGGEWTIKSGTATLKGKKTKGYLQTDSKTIGYTAASTKDETLATIKGVTATSLDSLPAGSDKVILSGNELSNSVTIDSKGILGFNFTSDYKDATITGSTSNDNIEVAGTGLKVNPGKGNDYVDFNRAGGNTFVYASGDGNDVIVEFSTTDKIEISKNKKAPVVTTDGGNTVIDVEGKGSITLEGYTGSVNINGSPVAPASADLLADDNYSMTAASLSEIIKPASDSYTSYDFNSDLQFTEICGMKAPCFSHGDETT